MENIENYLNTMIFIIIAKGITIALLITLLLEIGQQFSYIIITIQIGLLLVASWGIYMIVVYDKQSDKDKKAMASSPAILETCPDYYVRTYDESDNVVCRNQFTTADDRYTYTMFSSGAPPITGTPVDKCGVPIKNVVSAAGDLNMSALLASSKNMEELCNQSSLYANYPWTEYKAKCNKL